MMAPVAWSNDARLIKADTLRTALHARLGMSFTQADLLRDYRIWLDRHDIVAEQDEWNITEFVKDRAAIGGTQAWVTLCERLPGPE